MMRGHALMRDHDGFTADVEDVPSNWHPPFFHAVDPMILVCVPKRLGQRYYEDLKAEHEAFETKGVKQWLQHRAKT